MNRNVLNREGDDATLNLYGPIGGDYWDGLSARSIAKQLADWKSVKTITVNIDSIGGSVHEGVAIYNALTRHKAEITVNIDGLAASIASLIAMAGDRIRMAENALIMIHDPYDIVIGTPEELRKAADTMDKIKATLVTTYASRTGMGEDEISRLMSEETWFDADEALAAGFVDEISGAKKMAACVGLDKAKFKRVPESLTDRDDDKGSEASVRRQTRKEKEMADDKIDQPVNAPPAPASYHDLKQLSGGDSEFVCACMERHMTLDQARNAWNDKREKDLDELKSELGSVKSELEKTKAELEKAKEVKPSNAIPRSPGGDGDDPPVTGDFVEQAKAIAKRDNISIASAMSRLARENPELHSQYKAKAAENARKS